MREAQMRILTQNFLRRLGMASVRRVAPVLVLLFAGVVTAFGIAPSTTTDVVERTLVVEPVTLPTVDNSPPADTRTQTFWREERVQRGDTLASLLARLGVQDPDVIAFLNRDADARAQFQLVSGRTLRAHTDDDGALIALQLLNGERMITVERDDTQNLVVQEHAAQLEAHQVSASGVIRSSFFAALDAAQVPDSVARKFIEIFSTEIDFYRGLRRGDRFALVYEKIVHNGEPVMAGRLLAAEFVTQGRARNMLWFEEAPGKGGAYFTFDGRDTRKSAFLQTPLEVSRVSISSGFTEARFHPLLQTMQAHRGVDFVAPIGTRILAAADGVVDFAGVQQGYGNVVILKHHGKYSTLYAHMQDFAQGIQKGAKVKQGEVIGTVGMTGLTTGPHLHFEFLIDGVHHDPMSVDMPKAVPLAPDVKQAIRKAAEPYARTLALLRDRQPASFE